MAEAMSYALNHWEGLSRFSLSGANPYPGKLGVVEKGSDLVNVFLKILPSFMMTTKFLVGSSSGLLLAIELQQVGEPTSSSTNATDCQ